MIQQNKSKRDAAKGGAEKVAMATSETAKERALARTAGIPAHAARYQPQDELLEFLEGL